MSCCKCAITDTPNGIPEKYGKIASCHFCHHVLPFLPTFLAIISCHLLLFLTISCHFLPYVPSWRYYNICDLWGTKTMGMLVSYIIGLGGWLWLQFVSIVPQLHGPGDFPEDSAETAKDISSDDIGALSLALESDESEGIFRFLKNWSAEILSFEDSEE